jgi:hypothetical protein
MGWDWKERIILGPGLFWGTTGPFESAQRGMASSFSQRSLFLAYETREMCITVMQGVPLCTSLTFL